MPLQNDTKVLEIMYPAAKNEKAKNAWKKPKNKTTSQQYISLHIPLSHIMSVQNDTKTLKIMFPAAKTWLSQKMPEKAKNKNQLATVHFTKHYPSTICTFTKRH